MINGPMPPLEIPNEMRAVAQQSVEQAKRAFNSYMPAAQEAVFAFDIWIKASQIAAQDFRKKAMSFAQRNVLSAFEFSQKIAQAKDVEELIQMQTEFIRSQIQVLNDQVKDLGESATKTADTATTAVSETVNALGKNAEAA
jgi:phasin